MKKKLKVQKAFSLIEMLITLALISLITGLLLQIYIFASKVNIMVFEQKNLFSQILQINQILQNEIENSKIYYSGYSNLQETKGITDKLLLTGNGKIIELQTSGCVKYPLGNTGKKLCRLILKKNGKTIPLSNSKKILFTPLKFKIIPFEENSKYFQNPKLCERNFVGCLNFPGVRILGDAYSRDLKFHIPLELFFNTILEF